MTGTALIALSGGIDSTVALAHCLSDGYRATALTVDYGQRHAREIESAALVADHYDVEHVIVDLRTLGSVLGGSALTDPGLPVPPASTDQSATVVPNRNAIIAGIAVGMSVARGLDIVVFGFHGGDAAVYPDCRSGFVNALNRLAVEASDGHASRPVVKAPFVDWTKVEVITRGADLNVPFDLTWSCYRGGTVACGDCGPCVDNAAAFIRAGVR